MRFDRLAFACAALAFCSSGAFAQVRTAQAQTKPAPAPQGQQMQIPTVQLVAMIKTNIIALQLANQTGNYSVLRDLGTPVFREKFDQAALTRIFANMRQRGVNLTPVLFLPPNLSKQPEMKGGNVLHLTGNFATQPAQIVFDMQLMQIDNAWRIEGLAVDAVAPAQAQAAAQPQQQPQPQPQQPQQPQQQPDRKPAAKPDKKAGQMKTP
jgi:hypothetical protein